MCVYICLCICMCNPFCLVSRAEVCAAVQLSPAVELRTEELAPGLSCAVVSTNSYTCMCACIHICVCRCICIHTYVHTCICLYRHVYTYIYIHACM